MFFTVQNAVKEIFENEAVPGGRLERLASIHLGEHRLLASQDYPAAFIVFENSTVSGNTGKVEFDMTFLVFLFATGATVDESTKIMGELLWCNENGSSNGIIPVIILNSGFSAGGFSYRMEPGKTKVLHGKDERQRATTAAIIPLRVRTWRQLI